AERLDADEVAQDEHVEGDLEAPLLLDLRRREGALAGLVVLDDPPRGEWDEVDPVDLAAEREAAGEVEAALQLQRGALQAQRDLEAAGDELERRPRRVAGDVLDVARERLRELAALERGQVEPDAAAERVVEAAARPAHGLLDPLGLDPVATHLLREAR